MTKMHVPGLLVTATASVSTLALVGTTAALYLRGDAQDGQGLATIALGVLGTTVGLLAKTRDTPGPDGTAADPVAVTASAQDPVAVTSPLPAPALDAPAPTGDPAQPLSDPLATDPALGVPTQFSAGQ